MPLDRLFDYLSNGEAVQIGQRVLVPFGRRSQIGIVVGMANQSEFALDKLKAVTQVFNDEPALDSEALSLLKFSADYYHYPYGQALLSCLPARMRQIAPAVSRKQYRYVITPVGSQVDVAQLPARQSVLRRVLVALQTQQG